ARKCTFCLHRSAIGLPTACSTTCMGQAIHFVDIGDPLGVCRVHGEKFSDLLAGRSTMRLQEERGTGPSVTYLT
ncbi:MAG: hypothetical protein HZA54_01595, partial [Planctomycetes bacterium]|nr:hypothetical protein [Planctomycetota bacterium]